MRVRALIILFCLFPIGVAATPALAEKRVVLVIGNSAYQSVPKLANPVNDASAVTDMFRRAQFEVVDSRLDLNNADMRRAFREFSQKSRDADIAVIYYAGHGIEIDGQNYLIPTDAQLALDSDAFDEALPLDRVLQVIEPAKRLRLVILDACRDNPFARTMKRTLASRALGRGLVGVEPGRPNTLIAFAAKGGSTAADGAGTNSPFTTALLSHLMTPGLDLRQAFGRVRDDVMKTTASQQEPFVYGSLGGATVSLVPAVAAAPRPAAATTQPSTDPNVGVRKDYELALQLGNRQAWEFFLQQYSSGFYANLAKVQLDKIAAEEARAAATDKAKQAEAEKARLAAEKASAEQQAKAARESKAAEQARLAAEKQRQAEQAKAEAAERARAAAERAAAEKLAKEKAEAEAKAMREKAQAEVKAIREKAEADAKAAEAARKDAEKEAERLRLAALEQAKTANDKPAAEKSTGDKPVEVAALPAEAGKTMLSQGEINRSVLSELRRVGCHTAAVSDEWGAAARRSLELFNRHAGMKLEGKLASLDALDAVKGKQARVCPLVCEHGFRASGEKCERIVCRAGYRVGDENTCEKIERKNPVAKRAPSETAASPTRPKESQASGQQVFCPTTIYGGACQVVPKGCRIVGMAVATSSGGQRIACD